MIERDEEGIVVKAWLGQMDAYLYRQLIWVHHTYTHTHTHLYAHKNNSLKNVILVLLFNITTLFRSILLFSFSFSSSITKLSRKQQQ